MDIFSQLERDEGVRKFPYVDTVGKVTIGVGHNLTDKGLTSEQIDEILHDDVAEVQAALVAFPWFNALDDIRKAVFVNMAFNLGVNGLLNFQKTIAFVEAGQFDDAATEMLDSRWATQVGDRATRLSQQLRTDQWV